MTATWAHTKASELKGVSPDLPGHLTTCLRRTVPGASLEPLDTAKPETAPCTFSFHHFFAEVTLSLTCDQNNNPDACDESESSSHVVSVADLTPRTLVSGVCRLSLGQAPPASLLHARPILRDRLETASRAPVTITTLPPPQPIGLGRFTQAGPIRALSQDSELDLKEHTDRLCGDKL